MEVRLFPSHITDMFNRRLEIWSSTIKELRLPVIIKTTVISSSCLKPLCCGNRLATLSPNEKENIFYWISPLCAAIRATQFSPLWFSWTHCRGWNSFSMQAWHVISSDARGSSCSTTRSCRALQWSAGWWCSLHIRSTKKEFVNQPNLE